MVSFENVYSATEKAFHNDEFYELLTGGKGYNVPVLDAPVDVPTDWTVVISNGIYPLYKKLEDTKVKEYFQIALLKMMHGDSSDYPNGLLGDVERFNEILVNKYSVSMDGKNERL